MPLDEYRRKRNFQRTPEPQGKRAASNQLTFVVQKHAARRLHYDFRLEWDGVLKSWAVPKGPCLDPAVKSLAVQVEDHPLEYAGFEGIIPKGEYGGGTVMVWDRGTWQPQGNVARQLKAGTLRFELHGEKLHGAWVLARMRGDEDPTNWLLIKRSDSAARKLDEFDVLTEMPRSVVSGRDLQEIADNPQAQWDRNGQRKITRGGSASVRRQEAPPEPVPSQPSRRTKRRRTAARSATTNGTRKGKAREITWSSQLRQLRAARRGVVPKKFHVQLATLTDKVPTDDRWLHEMKLDGYRIVAHVNQGKARLLTRNNNDWTHRFASVVRAVQELPVSQAVFDGEVVVLNRRGISDFQRLQNALKNSRTDELVYFIFDMPYAEGFDLTRVPLVERKQALADLLLESDPGNSGTVRFSDHIVGNGEIAIDHACRFAMEGLISKKADSAYQAGRSRDWLKVKCLHRQEFVIGGYTRPRGSRKGFGALLLGYHDEGKLVYCGRVGTGFDGELLDTIYAELVKRRSDACPFESPMTTDQRRGVSWVRPELVAEVEFAEWTDDNLLRHAVFQGLREDKQPKEIVREVPERLPSSAIRSARRRTRRYPPKNIITLSPADKHAGRTRREASKLNQSTSNGSHVVAGIHLSNPDRVLYPQQGIRKHDLALYYEQIADWILPQLVDRPLTLVRCPQGRSGECFYQKHLTESSPDALGQVIVEEKGKRAPYAVVHDIAGLVSLVQIGVLEIHPWPARSDRLDRPDRLIFDLDPGEDVPWETTRQAALDVRRRLDELGLVSFVRVSGGKGVHVVTPIERRIEWDELKLFAKAIAEGLQADAPQLYTANMSKSKRHGKVFVDFHRNQRGATAIASYSTRARAGAPVATPLQWDELTSKVRPNQFSIADVPQRLRSLKRDPWDGFEQVRQTITKRMQAAAVQSISRRR